MATMTTSELVAYYVNLLIIQYHEKPKAAATVEAMATAFQYAQTSVQLITFEPAPSSGTFRLVYGEYTTGELSWDSTAQAVQDALTALDPLGEVLVTGDIATGALTVTFALMEPVALLLEVDENETDAEVSVTESDEIILLAMQNGFNLIGDETAVGAQLDMLGKYAGVSRTGRGFTTQITLDDADFLSLIQMAILKNSAGSSLYDIQALIAQFFAGNMLVFDYQNMQMSYLISTGIGSADLVQLFVTQGLLPKPMAVQIALVIYAPIITTFFGFRTYDAPAFNATPFNSYDDYQEDWPWLSYQNAVTG